MKKQKIQNILDKYLSGNSTKDEKELLNKFFDSYVNESSEINENIREKIKDEIGSKIFSEIKRTKPKKANYFQKIVASVAFLLVVSSVLLYYLGVLNNTPSELIWKEKTTLLGERSILKLSDGTKVVLNADSKLRYPKIFGSDTREVFLEGEAYFEVKSNPQKQFIVYSGDLSTSVLGTKFNVKNYPNEAIIQISLVEGKVKVTEKITSEATKELFLKPKQQVVYNKLEKTDKLNEFDFTQVTGWRNNILIFDNESLKDVFVKLERAFGVKLEIEDETFRKTKINTNFNNESFLNVVKVIKVYTGLTYETVTENNKIKKIIFRKKKGGSL